MKKYRIIILTKFDDWRVPPNVVNLIIRLCNKCNCVIYYQRPKRLNLKKLLKKRGFFIWLDFILARYLFKLIFPLRQSIFGRISYMQLMREKVNQRFNNTEEWVESFAKLQYVEDINNSSLLLKNIKKKSPSLIISMGAPILRKEFLKEINDLKILAVNSHIGITPDYMGTSPFIWALKKKDFSKIGFTIHKIHKKVDYGDYLYQKAVDISDCRTLTDIDWKLLIESSSFLAQKIMSQEIFHSEATPNIINYKSFPPAGLLTTLEAFINFRRFNKLCKRDKVQ